MKWLSRRCNKFEGWNPLQAFYISKILPEKGQSKERLQLGQRDVKDTRLKETSGWSRFGFGEQISPSPSLTAHLTAHRRLCCLVFISEASLDMPRDIFFATPLGSGWMRWIWDRSGPACVWTSNLLSSCSLQILPFTDRQPPSGFFSTEQSTLSWLDGLAVAAGQWETVLDVVGRFIEFCLFCGAQHWRQNSMWCGQWCSARGLSAGHACGVDLLGAIYICSKPGAYASDAQQQFDWVYNAAACQCSL